MTIHVKPTEPDPVPDMIALLRSYAAQARMQEAGKHGRMPRRRARNHQSR